MLYELIKNNCPEVEFTSNHVKGPSYIMPDGKYVDISNVQNIHSTSYKHTIHPDLDTLLINIFNPEYSKNILLYTDNAVKLQTGEYISCEKPYVILPLNQLSNDQYESLELWLFNLKNSPKHNLTVYHSDNNVVGEYDLSQIEPKDVINDIKKYFNNKGGEAL